MNSFVRQCVVAMLLAAVLALPAYADEVKIVAAGFTETGGEVWTVSVSLQHADTGWDHYADMWRVTDSGGKVLGERVLLHPHVDEQPFTRSLGDVKISGAKTVFIEAHDSVHGWTKRRLKVDLAQASSGHLVVRDGG